MTSILPPRIHKRSKGFLHRQAYSKEQAQHDNLQFDKQVKAFLREWLSKGRPENADLESQEQVTEEFINGGALREYFKRHEDPFQKLLARRLIARHLYRRHHKVYFDPATQEPMLSLFESRIYNLSAHRQHLQIPYRFIPISRQGSHGDRATNDELAPERQGKTNDIGDYFATRRADETVVKTMHIDLKKTINIQQKQIHIIDTHYMPDAMKAVVESVKETSLLKNNEPEFFILQSRYRPEGMDRHFGASLIIVDPAFPNNIRRVIFCDTVNIPGWRPLFGDMIKEAFGEEVESRIEMGSHPLQGLNREADISAHDINCSFYTHSMAYALLQITQTQPELLLNGTIEEIHDAMKASMYDYYGRDGGEKTTDVIKRTNLYKRWNIGHSMLRRL